MPTIGEQRVAGAVRDEQHAGGLVYRPDEVVTGQLGG
jgi:hypothetical protein